MTNKIYSEQLKKLLETMGIEEIANLVSYVQSG